MRRFEYFQPRTVEEALEQKSRIKGISKYIAGGTDVVVRLKQKLFHVDALVSLRGVRDLKGISINGTISIGALTTFREIEREGALKRAIPALHRSVSVIANPQIRNVATLGGNLCNAAPSADSAPPLLVYDAVAVLDGPEGTRSIELKDFFRGPGITALGSEELLKEIRIPRQEQKSRSAFIKMGRVSQDIAKVNVAALLVMEGDTCVKARLAAGAVAPVPLRLKACEEFLQGRKIDKDSLEESAWIASQEVRPITDVRSTEDYRRHVTGVLVKRAILEAMETY